MHCPDCGDERTLDRRQFLKTAALTGALAPAALGARTAGESETLVASFYGSLSDEQKQKICFPFDHPLRSKVDANWQITPLRIEEYFNGEQQSMIREIFRKLYNPQFAEKVEAQLYEDAGGLGRYSVALFGEPKTGDFEFVLTGRHCTVRCDGDSVPGVAFGGPIFYGHQAGPSATEKPDHPGNIYWYQAKRANEVFQALNGKQRETALIQALPRAEKSNATVELSKTRQDLAGLPVSDMSRDQRELVEKVLADLLLFYRKKDVDEAMKLIKAKGGVSSMAMSFYKSLDIGNDGLWDVWQLESPNMIWYFRGHPHVHVWVNLRA
ncbi:MAG: DUF3500 domain-containing protein [Bryobacteraceae bacterium]